MTLLIPKKLELALPELLVEGFSRCTKPIPKEWERIIEKLDHDIFNCFYGWKCPEYVYQLNREYTNSINSEGSVYVDINGNDYTVVVRDGDDNGSEILEFSTEAVFSPPPQHKHSFELDNHAIRGLSKDEAKNIKYITKQKYKQHQEMCRKYMYDKYFSTANNKIEKHYKAYMKKWYLILVSEEA